MGNLGGMEVLVIALVALVVLGPKKLPHAARQAARALTELKRISAGFQKEVREAMADPIIEAEARAEGARVVASEPGAATGDTVAARTPATGDADDASDTADHEAETVSDDAGAQSSGS